MDNLVWTQVLFKDRFKVVPSVTFLLPLLICLEIIKVPKYQNRTILLAEGGMYTLKLWFSR